MSFQEVVILGHTGNVGSELVRQIVELDGVGRGHEDPTRIVGVANTAGFAVCHCGFETLVGDGKPMNCVADLADRNLFQSLPGFTRYKAGPDQVKERYDEVIEAVRETGLAGEVVYVDATSAGSDEHTAAWREMHQAVLDSGDKLVTVNKNPLALSELSDFHRLVNDRRRYGFNGTVMAGGDAVRFLIECKDLSEAVYGAQGCFSGTLGYITSELHAGRPFSEIVRQAKAEGITEPRPQDDLNGLDVMRKLIILARSAGCEVDGDDLDLEPFIPDEYTDIADVDAFLDKISELDDAMTAKIDAAKANGNVLRYVAGFSSEAGITLDNKKPDRLAVGFQEVAPDSPLGGLDGTANMIEIYSNLRAPKGGDGDCPHVIQSKGAGVPRTAAAIRANLLQFLERNTNTP